MSQISFVLPSRNNLRYLKWSYESIRKNAGKEHWVCFANDASTDGTEEWIQETLKKDKFTKSITNPGPERVGHTILYDRIINELVETEVFIIFHSDMYVAKGAVDRIFELVSPGKIVCLNRIEPPLHPPGNDKIIADFGLEPEEFREEEFDKFIDEKRNENKDIVAKGIFAPWAMYKKDFQEIKGHDPLFAPMELEDSDIFNRFLMQGYEMIQARDAFVYHLTCRGSRYKDGLKIKEVVPLPNDQVWKKAEDSTEYSELRQIKFREWYRKWGADIRYDKNMLPIVPHKYDIGFVARNCDINILSVLEPRCNNICIESEIVKSGYILNEKRITLYNLDKRIVVNRELYNDIVVDFDCLKLNNENIRFLFQLSDILTDSGELGNMEYDIFKLRINSLQTYEKKLIKTDSNLYL